VCVCVCMCVWQSTESPPQPSTSQGTESPSTLIGSLTTPFSPSSGVPPQMHHLGSSSAMSQGGSVYSTGSGTPWDELESDSPTRGHRHAAQVRVSQTDRPPHSALYDSSRETLARKVATFSLSGKRSERAACRVEAVRLAIWAIPRHLTADTVSCTQLPTVTTRATCLSRVERSCFRGSLPSHTCSGLGALCGV